MSEFGVYRRLFPKEGTIFDVHEYQMNNQLTKKEMRDTKSAASWLYELNDLATRKKGNVR